MNRDVIENTADLCTYVNKVTEELVQEMYDLRK